MTGQSHVRLQAGASSRNGVLAFLQRVTGYAKIVLPHASLQGLPLGSQPLSHLGSHGQHVSSANHVSIRMLHTLGVQMR